MLYMNLICRLAWSFEGINNQANGSIGKSLGTDEQNHYLLEWLDVRHMNSIRTGRVAILEKVRRSYV